jgi:arylsulfatase A
VQQQHQYLYWEFHEHGGKQAVRMGRWKGVRLNLQADPAAPVELYDLSVDPGEQHDVADRHPDIVAEIRTAMSHRTQSEVAQWNFARTEAQAN